jgi:hypothetical protein
LTGTPQIPHGRRGTYAGGCRCAWCRAANTRYQRARKKRLESGWADAAPVRAHILELSKRGIGRRAIADSTDLSQTTIRRIRQGTVALVHATTAAKILAVDGECIADRARIDAEASNRIVERLVALGYQKAHIARALGYKGHALGYMGSYPTITARNALRLAKLYGGAL